MDIIKNQPTIVYLTSTIVFLFALKRWIEGPASSAHPDLKESIVIVTGANTGVGFTAATEIARLKPKALILACRSKERGEEAVREIREETGAKENVFFM